MSNFSVLTLRMFLKKVCDHSDERQGGGGRLPIIEIQVDQIRIIINFGEFPSLRPLFMAPTIIIFISKVALAIDLVVRTTL